MTALGGLTVVRALEEAMPDVSYTYLGDTARLPYGTKTPETIANYTLDALSFLQERGATVPIIACHTASSVIATNENLQEQIRDMFGRDAHHVVGAALKEVPTVTKSGNIGVLGTYATIQSNVYQHQLQQYQVTAVAASVLVGLAEEGFGGINHAGAILEEVLNPFLRADVDTVVLACTHFPLLAESIRDILGPDVALLDPGKALSRNLVNETVQNDGKRHFFATDIPDNFSRRASAFLGRDIPISRI